MVQEKKSASLSAENCNIKTQLMTLRNSMLDFVLNADDQNKSSEVEKVTISVATHFLTFLYTWYVEENAICFTRF